MSDGRILGEATEYDDIVEMYRQRVAEIGLTNEMIDHLSGLQSGYSGKLFGPAQTRSLGPASWGLLNRTLGLKVLIVIDDEATAIMQTRWEKRAKPANETCLPRASIKAITRFRPVIARANGILGASKGGATRALKLSKRARRMIARKAANKRWGRRNSSRPDAP
jgi:hypothetical protein